MLIERGLNRYLVWDILWDIDSKKAVMLVGMLSIELPLFRVIESELVIAIPIENV